MAYELIGPAIFELGVVEQPFALIEGTLYVENAPAQKRFMIIDRLSGEVIHSGLSNTDGAFKRYVDPSFTNNRKLYVISFDDTAVYNAEVADHINAVP